MPQQKRDQYINRRAYELSASGLHINPITVVSALVQEGFPEAAELLNSDIIRTDLRLVCTNHWQGVASVSDQPRIVAAPLEDQPAQPSRDMNE